MDLSLDELCWLHATDQYDPPPIRARTYPAARPSHRHRHYHLLDDPRAPAPRKQSNSLIPVPVNPTPPPPQWLYRSPRRPPTRPRPPTAYHSVLPRPLSAKDKEKERSIWAILRPPPANRASSASSVSTASASTPPTSPAPSVSASPKPSSSAPTKSILTRSPSASSRATPHRSLAALFSRATSSASVSSSVKSVTFVDQPTVHYPDVYDTDPDSEPEMPPLHHDDLASRLTTGALAWEMGLDIDSMDLDLSLDLNVSPSVNLDAPLELDIGQMYVPPKREEFAGILEEDEDLQDQVAPLPPKQHKSDNLKRFLTLSTEPKIKRRSAPLPARPEISGPFALGTSSFFSPSASRSSTSLRSQARLCTASTSSSSSSSTIRSRSNSNSTTDTLPVHRPRRPRTAPSPAKPKPKIKTSPGPGCGPYPTSLHAAPSLESFRSAAGRSVRSLGSIKSTASARSAFRALLSKIGISTGDE